MITMTPSASAQDAKRYFSDALTKGDYYLEGQEFGGNFAGKLAARLGLSGPVTKEQFFLLLENRDPSTGKRLTPRTSSVRTAGYDITFSVPKSVSVVHVLSGDDHILQCFQASVAETMAVIQNDARTRVRKNSKDFDRETNELIWAEFIHQTARPVPEHAPDPHLHSHCYVFNATWDDQEQRIKAGKFDYINQRMPLYQAIFNKKLSDKLIAAGYSIRPTKNDFEIDIVPQKVIDLFSKRTRQIEKAAQDKGITDAKALGELGARTRAAKDKGLSMAELKVDWRRQIRELDTEPKVKSTGDGITLELPREPAFSPVRSVPQPEDKPGPGITAQQCVDFAIMHGFERASVMAEDKLLLHACKHSIGLKDVSLSDIETCLHNDPRLLRIEERGKKVCTTREVLAEEKRMVDLARTGKGKMAPLYHQAPHMELTGQQANAAKYLLTNTDQVSIVRGAAGAGKTTLLKELVSKIDKTGRETMLVAPTAQASRSVLRQEGFTQADTVARLLSDKVMQDKLKNQVLIVDEAGLLGTKEMTGLISLTQEQHARLILVGDTRQHSSVTRGDALRVLNTVGGIRTAEVSKIHRQKNAVYKEAVEDLSKGQVKGGFDKLDGIGAIREISADKISEALVKDYVEAVSKGKSALIISPTHAQGEKVTNAVRDKLKASGIIGKREIPALSLVNENLTVAEKGDWRSYKPGQWVQFNQNTRNFPRGSQWKVQEATESGVLLQNTEGKVFSMPQQVADRFDVYCLKEIAIAQGDKLRVTKNGFDNSNRRLENGQTYYVSSIGKSGEIRMRNSVSNAEYSISNTRFGHIAHAHCITSHASQGKTVDQVFVAQPAATFGASDSKQFYVSVSRAREAVHVYTDDKAALLTRVSDAGDRRSALELLGKDKPKHSHTDYVHHLQKQDPTPAKEGRIIEKQQEMIRNYQNREDYEPTL